MWMEAVPRTGKMAAGGCRDFMPRPPMASGISPIMDVFVIAFFFFSKDLRLSIEGDDMGNLERICLVNFPA